MGNYYSYEGKFTFSEPVDPEVFRDGDDPFGERDRNYLFLSPIFDEKHEMIVGVERTDDMDDHKRGQLDVQLDILQSHLDKLGVTCTGEIVSDYLINSESDKPEVFRYDLSKEGFYDANWDGSLTSQYTN